MKINIVEDEQLRNELRKMIDGQFRSIIREEVRKQITVEVTKTVKSTLTVEVLQRIAIQHLPWKETLVREALSEVKKIATTEYHKEIEKQISKTDFNAVVDSISRKVIGMKLQSDNP